MDIKEALQKSIAKNAEVISIPVPGDKISILRINDFPQYGFLVWDTRKTSTHWQMSFQMEDRGKSENFSVVCACCGSELYGLDTQNKDEEWKEKKKQEFLKSILEICENNGITTIFLRKAKCWGSNYGRTDELRVKEAGWDFIQTILDDMYHVIRDKYSFISSF